MSLFTKPQPSAAIPKAPLLNTASGTKPLDTWTFGERHFIFKLYEKGIAHNAELL